MGVGTRVSLDWVWDLPDVLRKLVRGPGFPPLTQASDKSRVGLGRTALKPPRRKEKVTCSLFKTNFLLFHSKQFEKETNLDPPCSPFLQTHLRSHVCSRPWACTVNPTLSVRLPRWSHPVSAR